MPSGDLHPMTGQDALSPSEVAFLVETRGVAKATAPILKRSSLFGGEKFRE